jgi:hypothetical protein
MRPASTSKLHRPFLRSQVRTPGSRWLDHIRRDLSRCGVRAAVRRRDTPVLFEWLLEMVSYQGIGNHVAEGYMDQHGRLGWDEIAALIEARPSCPKLRSYWHFDPPNRHRRPRTGVARASRQRAYRIGLGPPSTQSRVKKTDTTLMGHALAPADGSSWGAEPR